MSAQKICIIGDGLAGLSTAIILSQENIKVDLYVGNSKKKKLKNNSRTTAISESSYQFIKSKLKHMISDCNLIARKDSFAFTWNSKFPINSLSVMRGYLFINNENKDLYLNVMFDAYWKNNLDISNEKIIKSLLKKCKIDLKSFFEGIKDPQIKEELKNVTQAAHDKEIFGAPTFVVNNKIFWGQDRLEFALDEYNK